MHEWADARVGSAAEPREAGMRVVDRDGAAVADPPVGPATRTVTTWSIFIRKVSPGGRRGKTGDPVRNQSVTWRELAALHPLRSRHPPSRLRADREILRFGRFLTP
ncbi:hypothetical protein ALMP_84800 [Streptomyces sp. A012304]|nr:hypothetical protein ALMP_84800 [Streptomyces sp. A012304]